MIAAGPLFVEGMTSLFGESSSRRMYRIYAVSLAAAVFVSWPSNPPSYYIQFNSRPITFPLSFMLMFVFAFILSIAPEYSSRRGRNTMTDWVFYTSVNVVWAYLGYLLYAFFQVAFILVLAAPILVAAAAASGLSLGASAAACLVVFSFCLFSKILVNTLNLVFEKHPFIKVFAFGVYLLFIILLSIRLVPVVNPVLSAQAVISGNSDSGYLGEIFTASWELTILSYAVGIVLCTLISVTRLALLRREAITRT